MNKWLVGTGAMGVIVGLLAGLERAEVRAELGGAHVSSHKQLEQEDAGERITRRVVFSNELARYVLQYEARRDPDDPDRAVQVHWGPREHGYLPLGMAEPSRANWYWQGFMRWTFGDHNLQDWVPEFQIVRAGGDDAVARFVWETPRVRATLDVAMTADSDKLLFFGEYEPRNGLDDGRLELMAYPATFSEPHQREATTARRSINEGTVPLDRDEETWVLLEDTLPGRDVDGSAGLLLGDPHAYTEAALTRLGGYNQVVDLGIDPQKQRFAFGLYDYPDLPDHEQTRAYFQRSANAESEALAAMLERGLDEPLPQLPRDEERRLDILGKVRESLDRSYENWSTAPPPEFPWAADRADGPLDVSLLAVRYGAYDTMELGRRLDMDVEHVYFDSPNDMVDDRRWYYDPDYDTLGDVVAGWQARRILVDRDPDVILMTGMTGGAVPEDVRDLVLDRVEAGAALYLAGAQRRWNLMEQWPEELTAEPAPELLEGVLEAMSAEHLPGLRPDDPDRTGGDTPFLRAYRYGEGHVIVFQIDELEVRRASLVPAPPEVDGLEGAADRTLALHAAAIAASAGEPLTDSVAVLESPSTVPAGEAFEVPVEVRDARAYDMLVRIQDDLDNTILLEPRRVEPGEHNLSLPDLPAGRSYFVDLLVRNNEERALGFASKVIDVDTGPSIDRLELAPTLEERQGIVSMVDLPDRGDLQVRAHLVGLDEAEDLSPDLSIDWRVYDTEGRLVGEHQTDLDGGDQAHDGIELVAPVTVAHYVEATLRDGERPLYRERQWFTRPMPYPYEQFTGILWGGRSGYLSMRHALRTVYNEGASSNLQPHMRRDTDFATDEGAHRTFSVNALSGLHPLPYPTRVAGSVDGTHRDPSLFDDAWIEREKGALGTVARQAAPYQPSAYTLGDENFILHRRDRDNEVSDDEHTMAGFREWLEQRYGGIEALNRAWASNYGSFADIEEPVWLEQAVDREETFTPWFDFRTFMDWGFTQKHEQLAAGIDEEDPGARVGFDGFLEYHWQSGYDFDQLTRNLRLNQVYQVRHPQGDFLRSLRDSEAMAGRWINHIADDPNGYAAVPWHDLFMGFDSIWWWSLWNHNATPFYPDGSLSAKGRAFFDALAEIRRGPGRLLGRAERQHSGVAVLYNHADIWAARLATEFDEDAAFQPDDTWVANHSGLVRGLDDTGFSFDYVAANRVEADPQALEEYRVLFLPLATAISDELVETIDRFVREGGKVIADGRAAMLTESGQIRERRPLDELFGIESRGGREGFVTGSEPVELTLDDRTIQTHALEPDIEVTAAAARQTADGIPMVLSHRVGEGAAAMTNFPFELIADLRDGQHQEGPVLDLLEALIATAGPTPKAEVEGEDGRARNSKLSLFAEGPIKYLGVEQDVSRTRLAELHIPDEKVTLTIDEPAHVYDVRGGEPVGAGRTDQWEVMLSRGAPHLFALMPYRLAGVDADVSARHDRGEPLEVPIRLSAETEELGAHVVHVSVYAPGAEEPHREYSGTVDCLDGQAEFRIPFALNDERGTWRLEIRDAATGVETAEEVELR